MSTHADRPRDSDSWRVALSRLQAMPARLRTLIWPPVCAACGQSIKSDAGELCDACACAMAGLVGESFCLGCGEPRPWQLLVDDRCGACRTSKPPFHAFVRVGPYAGPLQSLILQFKRRMTLDRLLGGWMADAVTRRGIATQIDIWTPVPSPLLRRVQRGFQPTRLLASELARRTGRPVASLLAMARHVPRFHHGMSATRRKEAIHGAFRVVSSQRVDGRIVGLVDDVTTTGATLREARRMLIGAGAKGVVAVVLAKTETLEHAEAVRSRGPSIDARV